MITLDTGHFHPTESVADKSFFPCCCMSPELMLHVSRPTLGLRPCNQQWTTRLWIYSAKSFVATLLDRVHYGLDYFDASINRIGAYVNKGSRAAQKWRVRALLEPIAKHYANMKQTDKASKCLALSSKKKKGLPWNAVWDMSLLEEQYYL